MFKKILILCLVLSAYNIANAAEGNTGWRTITGLGCHLVDGTCYFDISGEAVGNETCSSTNVRFDILKSPNGKAWFSMIEAAYFAKRKITLNILGCYGGYPTFNYGRIAP